MDGFMITIDADRPTSDRITATHSIRSHSCRLRIHRTPKAHQGDPTEDRLAGDEEMVEEAHPIAEASGEDEEAVNAEVLVVVLHPRSNRPPPVAVFPEVITTVEFEVEVRAPEAVGEADQRRGRHIVRLSLSSLSSRLRHQLI